MTEDDLLSDNYSSRIKIALSEMSDIPVLKALISAGAITQEEAKTHPERHVLTQALATRDNINLHTFIDDLSNYDYFLLCSDGLTNMIENEEIQDIVRNNELSISVEKLIELCVNRGGVDNISVAIIKNLGGVNHDK